MIPRQTEAEIAEGVRAAMRCHENGVTSVLDVNAAPKYLRVYQKLQARR